MERKIEGLELGFNSEIDLNPANLRETLSILMLVGEEERHNIPAELMIENVTVRSDGDIKDELLDRTYDTVFITRDYVRIYGATVVKHMIKLYTTLTTTRIHYLQGSKWNEGDDEVSSFLKLLGNGNITKVDVMQLTVASLRTLARENRAVTGFTKDDEEIRYDNLIVLGNELRNLPENMVQDYVKKNRGEILEVITSYLNTMKEVEQLNKENQKLLEKTQQLEGDNKALNRQLMTAIGRRDAVREDLRSLRKSILTQKDKIDEYNERVVGSEIIDGPEIKLGELSPIIIYFKEIEDIGFFSFYESILYTLSKVYKYYVKSVVLETHNRHFFDPYTALGYTAVPKETTLGTIIENDKLVRYGNPTGLLLQLANPEFKTEIIMVYDRTQTDEVLIKSPYLFPMYIGYSRDRINTLEIEPIGWISPLEGSWKNVEPLLTHIDKSPSDRLVYNSHVSKHPLTTYIRELVSI